MRFNERERGQVGEEWSRLIGAETVTKREENKRTLEEKEGEGK